MALFQKSEPCKDSIVMNAYDKSNSIEAVKLSRLSHKEYKAVLSATESISDRQKQAQALCDYQTLKIN